MDEVRKKDIVLGDQRKFGEEQTELALEDLREYFAAKASIDEKATANEEWWRLRHWNVLADTNEGVKAGVQVGSAWLFNSLMNKHADIMDSFPRPNILPREADDEVEAKILTSIIPTLLEQNDYEQVYRTKGWDILRDGACITSVLWDPMKANGLGDIAITNVDVHNLAWKPGIEDIQDSDKVYFVTLQNVDTVRAKWPKIADKIGPQDTGIVTRYVHDDNIDTSNFVEVIDMYYKKVISQPVYSDVVGEDGRLYHLKVMDAPRTILHLAIIVGDQLAFCSENEEGYENGYYEHGRFPFVVARAFPIKDTIWGFGYLDIMKNPQRDIDRLDQAIIKNAMMKARPRYWARKNANIDVDKFADWDEELVEVATGDLGDAVRKIDVDDVPAGAMNHLMSKVDELKETSGNRDFSQGGTAAGITSGAAIAALQEAGSKTSRDLNKELYRATREEYYLVIELIRQFYSEPRSFRLDASVADTLPEPTEKQGYEIQDSDGDYRFVLYSNAGIVDKDTIMPDKTTRHIRPMFDIQVTAEKASPFSRAAQNELAKELYQLGLFTPENTLPAMTCIDMMDFDGKEKVKQELQQNSMIMQQLQAAMQMIQQQAMIDPAFGMMAAQQGLVDPAMMAEAQAQAAAAQQGPAPAGGKGTPEERVERRATDSAVGARIRSRAANASNPQ